MARADDTAALSSSSPSGMRSVTAGICWRRSIGRRTTAAGRAAGVHSPRCRRRRRFHGSGRQTCSRGFDDLAGRFRYERFRVPLAERAPRCAPECSPSRRTVLALIRDVDLSTPLDELAKLVGGADRGADVAIGSRGLDESNVLVRQPWYRELAGKTFNVTDPDRHRSALARYPVRFQAVPLATARRLFELQRVDGFAFDVELLVLARRLDLRVTEVPVRGSTTPTRASGSSARRRRWRSTRSASRTATAGVVDVQSTARMTAHVTPHRATAASVGTSRKSTCSGSSPA